MLAKSPPKLRKKQKTPAPEKEQKTPFQPASEVDPNMPPLEDADQPKKKFKSKAPATK